MTKLDSVYGGGVLDEEERNRLLMQELPQVRYIARHIHDRLPQHVLLEDLVHAGVLGLIDALQKYDATKNAQFKTYAKFRIRGAILDSLREMDWSPRDLRRKARKLEEVTTRLGHEHGRVATEQEIAREMNMSIEELHQMLSELEGLDLGSLQTVNTVDGHDEDLCEYLPGDPEASPYCLCLKSEMKQLLARAIRQMSEKEQQVLSLYYFEEMTMKEIGAVFGIGESRVSQIHSLALVRLRAELRHLMRRKALDPKILADNTLLSESLWKRS